jgi:hypothetical protein
MLETKRRVIGQQRRTGSYDPAASPAGELYFSAGPDHSTGGLFGYLKPGCH